MNLSLALDAGGGAALARPAPRTSRGPNPQLSPSFLLSLQVLEPQAE